ncbi:MAG: phosphonoacetaldehyde reductase [Planctomycetota bacterium]|nr:phosphonoacetaldehyde reductase [Planctomycetota bacterium]
MIKDFVGFGALSEALEALASDGYKRIFVVASPGAWGRFTGKGEWPFFHDRTVEVFGRFSPNPDFREILAGMERFNAFKPDLIMAIGGGSPIDVAKMIRVMAYTVPPYDPESPEKIVPAGEGPPLVAVATTAGSGAEATRFAVFYVGERKQSMAHDSLRPEVAVVDPELTYSMPPKLTAECGFDALSQAVESYWAVGATDESREIAAAAMGYILPNLYNAVHEPQAKNRYNMAIGAYQAGRAINITRTTVPHALGYHLTKKYGLSHGHSVALTLPFFLVINSDPNAKVTAPGGADAHCAMMRALLSLLGQETALDAAMFWRNLLRTCGLTPTLRGAGLTTDTQLRALIASVNPARLGNNPVAVDVGLLLAIFRNEPEVDHDDE